MTTDSTLVGRIVGEWADRLARGEPVAADAALAQYPELADQLRPLLSALGAVSAISTDPTLPRLVGFRVVRELGRGGMGVVYEAEDEALGRRVAVKVLPPHLLGRPEYVARFRQEARAAAGLHHTHIVPVFGAGECGGAHYIVMQFIAGSPPEPGTTLLPYRVASLGAKLADALAFAHAHGILHRDVKPGNVLIDAAGEPWLADFGLARVDAADAVTDPAGFVGTLRYAAPERFTGVSDARSDVYSLGLTLYELATGRPAFDATDRAALTAQLNDAAPPRPRAVNPTVPQDLETVLLKAIARDPAHRYQSAAALADDLRRVADGRPILAKRIGPVGRLWRWAKRHPVIAALSAAVFVSLALGLGGVYWQWRQAEANLKQAEDNAEATRRANAEAMAKVRTFYTGMDSLDDFMTFNASTKTDVKLLDQKWQAFQPVLAVYDDFLRQPADDPEVFALQVHALFQRAAFLNRFRRFEGAEADCRRAAEWYTQLPPDDTLQFRIHSTWGIAAANHPDAAVRANGHERVRAYFAPRLEEKDRRQAWATLLYLEATGPLLAADPFTARDRIVEAVAQFEAISPYHQMLVAPPGSAALPQGLTAFWHVCFTACDVSAVAALAERRHAVGDLWGASILWAKCSHLGTDDADLYRAKALAALNEEVRKRPYPYTSLHQIDDFKPFLTDQEFRGILEIIRQATSPKRPPAAKK